MKARNAEQQRRSQPPPSHHASASRPPTHVARSRQSATDPGEGEGAGHAQLFVVEQRTAVKCSYGELHCGATSAEVHVRERRQRAVSLAADVVVVPLAQRTAAVSPPAPRALVRRGYQSEQRGQAQAQTQRSLCDLRWVARERTSRLRTRRARMCGNIPHAPPRWRTAARGRTARPPCRRQSRGRISAPQRPPRTPRAPAAPAPEPGASRRPYERRSKTSVPACADNTTLPEFLTRHKICRTTDTSDTSRHHPGSGCWFRTRLTFG